jgi:RHS repeat-associated protein
MACQKLNILDQNFTNQKFVNQTVISNGDTCAGKYRFGFNGKEKDDEWNGQTGSTYDFGARLYDARIGRWMACDPLAVKYPNLSAYNYCTNNPIYYVDPDGKDIWIFIHKTEKQYSGHALIGVTEYDELGNKTGNILVYELFPKDTHTITGDNPVIGYINKQVVSINDISDFAKQNEAEFLRLETSLDEDVKATDMLDQFDEKFDDKSLMYRAGTFNCTSIAIFPLRVTNVDNRTNLGEESVEFKALGISTAIHAPNKLWNDLLSNERLVETSNGGQKLEEGMVKKYLVREMNLENIKKQVFGKKKNNNDE